MTIPLPPPVRTVDRFGINVTGNTGQGPMLQPKLKHHFRVLLIGFGGASRSSDPITLNTNTCGLPSQETAEIETHSYNSIDYHAGKARWGEITTVVRDTVDNSVVKAIGAQLQFQQDHYNQSGYRAGQDYKFTMQIQLLNGGYDTATAAWTCEGCWLKTVAFGEVDYSVSEPITISMTIRPTNCILEDMSGQNSIFPNVPADPLGTFISS
jgi:hypothetical protein